MQVRFARHTERLTDVVCFYRDELGLPEIGRFENHDGYDGVFLAVPGSTLTSSSQAADTTTHRRHIQRRCSCSTS